MADRLKKRQGFFSLLFWVIGNFRERADSGAGRTRSNRATEHFTRGNLSRGELELVQRSIPRSEVSWNPSSTNLTNENEWGTRVEVARLGTSPDLLVRLPLEPATGGFLSGSPIESVRAR